jgi:hypothetical protein
MPSAQLPLAITQHVVDGCVDPWNMVPALKLADLLKAHTDFAESSLSTRTFVLAMSKAAYDRMPRDLKTIIDGNSGQLAAGMAGTMWDLQAAAVADMVSQRGDPVTTLMPEAVAHWRKATEPVIAAWLKEVKEQKIDGGKLLASAHALLAKYADAPEPQPPQPPQPAQPAQPQQSVEAKTDVTTMPKVEAPPAPPAAPAAPGPTAAPMRPLTSPAQAAAPATAVAKPPPVPAAPPKTLDIPL